MEKPYFRTTFFWGVHDHEAFATGIDALVDAARENRGWFASDNLIAFGRNLGFLNDQRFVTAWKAHVQTGPERGVIWRTAVAAWAATQAMRREGDFVECGCYRGTTARILMDYVDLSQRSVYLYDLFEHDSSMPHHAMTHHGPGLYEEVRARFADFPNVSVIKGSVPDSFAQGFPKKVAFAHIDMNNAPAEIGALNALEPVLAPGAVILLDDFGAAPYRAQHVAETKWFAERGIPVLELPTSQGLAIW